MSDNDEAKVFGKRVKKILPEGHLIEDERYDQIIIKTYSSKIDFRVLEELSKVFGTKNISFEGKIFEGEYESFQSGEIWAIGVKFPKKGKKS